MLDISEMRFPFEPVLTNEKDQPMKDTPTPPKSGSTAKTTQGSLKRLQQRAGDVANLSSAVSHLAEKMPARATLGQVLFFLEAGFREAMGQQVLFSEIRDSADPEIGKTFHSTYGILLEPSHQFPKGLGWLKQGVDPTNKRLRPLSLTEEGERVLYEVLQAATGKA